MNPIVVVAGEDVSTSAALPWAGELATLMNAPLQVLRFDRAAAGESATGTDHAIAAVLAAMSHPDAEVIGLEGAEPLDDLTHHLITNEPSVAVLDAADASGSGVLGSGMPALHLLHHTTVPVAVVPTGYEPLANGLIVVGVDGSGANATALTQAENMAKAAGARLHAVFAYDPVDDTFSLPDGWHRHSDDVRAEIAKLTEVSPELVMAPGHPVEVLVEHATQEKAAAVVIGTRGRGGFSGLRLGRVPSQLVSHATTPVVVVPH